MVKRMSLMPLMMLTSLTQLKMLDWSCLTCASGLVDQSDGSFLDDRQLEKGYTVDYPNGDYGSFRDRHSICELDGSLAI
nr:ferredoxin-3, chloroplastic [Quercus suber]